MVGLNEVKLIPLIPLAKCNEQKVFHDKGFCLTLLHIIVLSIIFLNDIK